MLNDIIKHFNAVQLDEYYTIETRFGLYRFRYNSERRFESIFGRFIETIPQNHPLINPYSGKLNFHGLNIQNFIKTIESL